MKREYYIDGEQVTRYTYFKCLEDDVFKYWQMSLTVGRVLKTTMVMLNKKIRSGSEYSYGHTYWGEVIR
jgi:hypothetical protein